MTSSWGDCSPGPLGINIPAGLISEEEVLKFNRAHVGVAHALISESRSHFMTGASFAALLYQLYAPAFDRQRRHYGLTGETRGKFMADAWSGFRSTEQGEQIERSAWQKMNNVEMPYLGKSLVHFVSFCCMDLVCWAFSGALS